MLTTSRLKSFYLKITKYIFLKLILCFKESGGQVDIISTKDAMMFPVIASCALGGLYIIFKV